MGTTPVLLAGVAENPGPPPRAWGQPLKHKILVCNFQTTDLDKATNFRLHPVSTQEWLQLRRPAKRSPSLLHGILGLQTVVKCRSARANQRCLAHLSARPGQKKPQWTTLLLIDSQAVKNACNASVESKGFCFYKATNGKTDDSGGQRVSFKRSDNGGRADLSSNHDQDSV